MTQDQDNGRYLLAIQPIPPKSGPQPSALGDSDQPCALPAYFVGSTAPNNVENGVKPVPNPEPMIEEMAEFLSTQDQPELLIAIHGYNTALGGFADDKQQGRGVMGWYQDIADHITNRCLGRSKGLMLIGYRWPSEQINGVGNDTIGAKIRYAQQSLPLSLKAFSAMAIAILAILTVLSLLTDWPTSPVFGLVGVILIVLSTAALSIILTLFLLRIAGYFRDSFRASNFGVTDLVELIRQLDSAILNAPSEEVIAAAGAKDCTEYWSQRRIKLSFIGHSMGGFVVTNTVRILSDVFDTQSIGRINLTNSEKTPKPDIGNVFALGRLVLVSPDIPAETIISSRANFLRSSLRRFEEAYLFSNEGDMALKLASTAANYASFPARTREGGYRLGNVVVQSPDNQSSLRYGIVNFDDLKAKAEPDKSEQVFLNYLFILPDESLLKRQTDVEQQTDIGETQSEPIAELFTVFDCTDYREYYLGEPNEPVGMLSRALGKRSLSFLDYVRLTYDYFTGKIDTHGGYFASADVEGKGSEERKRPEARLTKHLIYGLACLGFDHFLATPLLDELLKEHPTEQKEAEEIEMAPLQKLSQVCRNRQIQVLLAPKHYE